MCDTVVIVSHSGTAVLWRIAAGASTGNRHGTTDSLEILELKVDIVFVVLT